MYTLSILQIIIFMFMGAVMALVVMAALASYLNHKSEKSEGWHTERHKELLSALQEAVEDYQRVTGRGVMGRTVFVLYDWLLAQTGQASDLDPHILIEE